RRPATPLASRALEEALGDEGLDGAGSSSGAMDELRGAPSEDTGNVGLFAHTRRADEDGELPQSRRVATGNRPGVAAPAAPPPFAARAATGPAASVGGDGTAPAFEALLADAAVTQILLTGPDAALVDRGAGLVLHTDNLGDPNAVADALWRYANTAYPPPPPENPVVDVRLLDGTRVS